MTPLEDSYRKYRELGFTLNPTKKNTKHSGKAGAYSERANSNFSKKATGYAAIIPPSIIIVDADTYEEDCQFDKLVKDLGYKPEPFALTPSGGTHYAFYNDYPEKVIGKHSYKNVDIYAGYQSVVPIVATTVINKQGELAQYQWADPIDDEFVVNRWDEKFLELFEMRDRGVASNSKYEEEEDDLDMAMRDDPNRKADGLYIDNDEIDNLLAKLPDELEYDDWIEVGMTLYDRYKGSDEGRQKFIDFSKRSSKYDPKSPKFIDPAQKWDSGAVVPNQITYKRLAIMATEFSTHFPTDIQNAKTPDELDEVITRIADTAKLNTRTKADGVIRNELATVINGKLKSLKKEFPEVQVKQARTIVKDLVHTMDVEDLEDQDLIEQMDGLEMYVMGNKFVMLYQNTLHKDVGIGSLKTYQSTNKIHKNVMDIAKKQMSIIAGIKEETSYLTKRQVEYEVQKSPNPSEPPYLHVLTNPLWNAEDYVHDDAVIKDFYDDIWKGKAEDIIRLIALTIKYKETKLNKIMLVAPSNSGKTVFVKHVGFQELHMNRLLSALSGTKGIGVQVIKGLTSTGLMLIDEVNDALPQDIKNIDDYIYLDQFSSGGTQEIKLHFTVMTSTHKTATRTTSDEMFNRLLQVELHADEMEHTLSQSKLLRDNADHYTKVVRGYARYMLKDTLTNPMYDKKSLHDLQDKYRLTLNNDMEDILQDISERVISNVKGSAGTHGDVIHYREKYYIKRKKEFTGMVEDMLNENSEIDTGKFSEKLVTHLMPSDTRKSVKIDGKPLKYYELNLKPYYANEEEAILDEFEDLDKEEFE